jgi:hypothetical protein
VVVLDQLANMEIKIVKINTDISQVSIQGLSLFLMQKLVTENYFITYTKQPTDNYIESNELTDNTKQLSANHAQAESLGRLYNLTFTIKNHRINKLANNYIQYNLPEFQELAKMLDPTVKQKDPVELNLPRHNPDIKQTEHLTTLDCNATLKNKILFYYLFPKLDYNLPELLEKIELMSLEKQENIFERIFELGVTACLPKILYHLPFTSIQIIDTISNLWDFVDNHKLPIAWQNLSTEYGYESPQSLTSSNNELFYKTMENIKLSFNESYNPYIISSLFKQAAIISINLQQYEVLRSSKNPLAQEIIQGIHKEFPFLNITS